ncbi:cell envelope protein, partial [Mycolicibacterium elephantis]
MIRRVAVSAFAAALLAACSTTGSEEATTTSQPPPSAEPVSLQEARAIAKEAYIYGFPLVDSYRIQYSYFVDKHDPEYRGGFNEVHSEARLFTPEDKAV